MNNTLWDYSSTLYARKGVSEVCLRLQDSFDFDVNVLLYSAWLGSLSRELSVDHLRQLEALISPWREDVIKPMRALRRELKALPHMATGGQDVQALELEAERQQQDVMYEFFQSSNLPQIVSGSQEQHNLLVTGRYRCPDTTAWREDMQHLTALIVS